MATTTPNQAPTEEQSSAPTKSVAEVPTLARNRKKKRSGRAHSTRMKKVADKKKASSKYYTRKRRKDSRNYQKRRKRLGLSKGQRMPRYLHKKPGKGRRRSGR